MDKAIKRRLNIGFICTIICFSFYAPVLAANDIPTSPCQGSINDFKNAYENNLEFKNLMDSALNNVQHLPAAYPNDNPWLGASFSNLTNFFTEWCTFLPEMNGGHDDGLKYIQNFAWFYYQNEYGVKLVKESPGREITQKFSRERGAFMDSKASTAEVAGWMQDSRVEIEEYVLPEPKAPGGGFKSFNEFFAREFINQSESRPQTMPDRDYIISAPTDCIMNSIPQKITDIDTKIQTKFNQALNIVEMLDGSKYANRFIGGTALSCVLMPNTYHHYHSPVSGEAVESKVIADAYYGYDNFPDWAPANGNVGYSGTEFNQFEDFKRGYFIIDTKKFGHVAMVPVGLNTISSIVFENKFQDITKPVPVTRGDKLGHFLYGGSMVIMIFEPDRYKSAAIQVRLGNQIGLFDTKSD